MTNDPVFGWITVFGWKTAHIARSEQATLCGREIASLPFPAVSADKRCGQCLRRSAARERRAAGEGRETP